MYSLHINLRAIATLVKKGASFFFKTVKRGREIEEFKKKGNWLQFFFRSNQINQRNPGFREGRCSTSTHPGE